MHEAYQRGTCVVIQQIVIVDEAIFVHRNDRDIICIYTAPLVAIDSTVGGW